VQGDADLLENIRAEWQWRVCHVEFHMGGATRIWDVEKEGAVCGGRAACMGVRTFVLEIIVFLHHSAWK
jgi:hypothetical protein